MDARYFIAKFEAIQDESWTTGTLDNLRGAHCALGHCGPAGAPEAVALRRLFGDSSLRVTQINDGYNQKYKQTTPKARILAALCDTKTGKGSK